MFNSNLKRLEKRIERLECKKNIVADDTIKIYLDFNDEGEKDKANIYLLAVIPPKSRWRTTK